MQGQAHKGQAHKNNDSNNNDKQLNIKLMHSRVGLMTQEAYKCNSFQKPWEINNYKCDWKQQQQ